MRFLSLIFLSFLPVAEAFGHVSTGEGLPAWHVHYQAWQGGVQSATLSALGIGLLALAAYGGYKLARSRARYRKPR